MKSSIGIKKVINIKNQDEIKTNIVDLLNQFKQKNLIKIPENANIIIKPNICLVKGPETGTTVDPYIVKYIVEWLLQNFSINKITIGESDATELNIEIAYKALGWSKIFSQMPKVSLLNLSKDTLIDVQINGNYFKKISMPKTYMEADYLISVAKLKTHTSTKITCNLKNLYGANPIKYKAQYHKNLDTVIVDLNIVRKPDLCFVDGLIAMDGPGPVNGFPKPMGLLIIGNDAVASDHACSRIMGFNPREIVHLNLAKNENLGSDIYEVFGERIDAIKETFIIESNLRKMVINSKKLLKIPYINKLILLFTRFQL